MSIVEKKQLESTLTSEAVGMLDCFSCEFDELLSEIAYDYALARTQPGEAIVIQKADVIQAAKVFFDSVQKSNLSAETKAEVAAMMDCINSKDCP
jgi:hypothetical protein